MNIVSSPNRNDAGIAVIRNYQPARIERELLAQVFEIVGHPATGCCQRRESHDTPVETSLDRLREHAKETTDEDEKLDSQQPALEAVA